MSIRSELYEDIKNIQNAINKNTIVLFIGAGVSANSGIPTWGSLISDLAGELGLDGKIRSDEYLRVAQYYYNRNKDEYNKKIEQKLHKNWQPNEISKFLLANFNARYYITTNYDNILEQTAEKLSVPCKVISKDTDIPNIGNNTAIIKMHGDFNSQIVLKENDYLEYSQNFKLMETFVKSIFATRTVLFVGFSADDPNVNQIYSWVNKILEKNQREAYLLQMDKRSKDYKLQKEYFGEKGIKIINYYDLTEEIKKMHFTEEAREAINNLPKIKGKQLFKLLYLIKNFTSDYLEHYYLRLQPVKYLNFTTNDELLKILGDSFWRCNNSKISAYDDKNFDIFLKELKRKDKFSSQIINLLSHMGINELVSYKWEKSKLKENNKLVLKSRKEASEQFKALELINCLDYSEAKRYLQQINEKYSNDADYINDSIDTVNIFEKPYLMWKLGDYKDAFVLLKQIAYAAKTNQFNLIYIIAVFNAKIVGQMYCWQIIPENHNDYEVLRENLRRELNSINISELMERFLSPYEKDIIENKLNFKYLKELELQILRNQNEKVEPRLSLSDLYYTYTGNYIFIDAYSNFKKLCKCLVKALMAFEERNINQKDTSVFLTNRTTFNSLELILMITYLNPEDLKEIIYESKIKNILLEQKEYSTVKEDLLKAYKNCINSIIELDLCKVPKAAAHYFNYLYNFFTIFSLIKLTKKETTAIISLYIKLLRKYNYFNFFPIDSIISNILDFIIIEYNNSQTRKNIDYKVLLSFMKYFLKEIAKQRNINKNSLYRFSRFANNITYIIKELKPYYAQLTFKINDSKILPDLLTNIYNYVYEISTPDIKLHIKKLIIQSLEQNFSSELYHNACLNKIIAPNKNYENKILEDIEGRIRKYNELKITKPNTRNGLTHNPVGLDEIYEVLDFAANLINNEKFINVRKFAKYKRHKDFKPDNYFNFIFDMQKYNYKNFDLSYLKYISDKRLKKLKDIINKDDEKKEIIKQKLFNNISIEKDNNNICRNRLLYIIYNEDLRTDGMA